MQELILEEKTTLSPVMKEIYRRLVSEWYIKVNTI